MEITLEPIGVRSLCNKKLIINRTGSLEAITTTRTVACQVSRRSWGEEDCVTSPKNVCLGGWA